MKSTSMKTKQWVGAGLLSLVPALALGNVTQSGRTLQGVVHFAGPVSHATIKVLDKAGHTVVSRADATNGDGYFSVSLPIVSLSTDGLRVEATKGRSKGAPLEGTLSAMVTGETLMHLNAATTLSSHYQELDSSLSVEQADQRTRNFLGLPGLLDSGFSIENPYLTSFSAGTLATKAQAAGGLDSYLQELAIEMRNPDAIHQFPALRGASLQFGPAWVGEKLLAGVVGQIGSQLFSKFMDGIGFPDQSTQIFNLLNQVMARLAEIQNTLNRVEQAIKQSNYDVRASKLWGEYHEYVTIVNQIKATNVIANANLDAQGKPKDPIIAANVKKAGEDYIKAISDMGLKFVSNVNAEFVTEGTITPLPKIFAEVKWMDGNIIDKGYFNTIYGQLEQYRSFQAVATALLIDAERVSNPVKSASDLTVALDYINAENVVFPSENLFKADLQYVNSIIEGRTFYDRASNLLWMTKYAHFDSCEELQRFGTMQRHGGYAASIDEIGALLANAKINGLRWSDATKVLGFSNEDSDGVKMITQACLNIQMSTQRLFIWFGNDRQGPYSAFQDWEGQYNNVRASKGMKGIDTMIAFPLDM